LSPLGERKIAHTLQLSRGGGRSANIQTSSFQDSWTPCLFQELLKDTSGLSWYLPSVVPGLTETAGERLNLISDADNRTLRTPGLDDLPALMTSRPHFPSCYLGTIFIHLNGPLPASDRFEPHTNSPSPYCLRHPSGVRRRSLTWVPQVETSLGKIHMPIFLLNATYLPT